MTRGLRILLLGASAALAGSARTLAIATATIANPLTDSFSISSSYDEYFALLVTGGTGNAFFSPRLSAAGEITDGFAATGSRWAVASATLSVPGAGVSVRGPDDQNPGEDCLSANGCRLPFTFGVPEIVHITASARVGYACSSGSPIDCGNAAGILSASASFDGLGNFIQYYPGVRPPSSISAQYTLTPIAAAFSQSSTVTPEPDTIALVFSGLLALFWRHRTRGSSIHGGVA